MLKHKPYVEELLKKAKETNETIYSKMRLVAMYEYLGVDMYLLPDKNDSNTGYLCLHQFKFSVGNTPIISFNNNELTFAIEGKDYNTIWYNLFDHIHFADSIVDLKKNETFKKITERWLADPRGIVSVFEIDDNEHIMTVGYFDLEDEELAKLPSEYGWEYNKTTKILSTKIPPIIIEDGIKSYHKRLVYVAQKIDILEDYFMELHLGYDIR